MSDLDELIKYLRYPYGQSGTAMREAADALERLTAENERLEAEIDEASSLWLKDQQRYRKALENAAMRIVILRDYPHTFTKDEANFVLEVIAKALGE